MPSNGVAALGKHRSEVLVFFHRNAEFLVELEHESRNRRSQRELADHLSDRGIKAREIL